MGLLYKLDFASGKSYIGITSQPLKRRINGHADETRKGCSLLVHRAWRKYGAPKLAVLAIVDRKDLLETERRAIAVFGTLAPGGYNLTAGGDANPMHSPIAAAKQGLAMVGKRHSVAAKAKMSAAKADRKLSEEHKRKISAALKHRPASLAFLKMLKTKNPMSNPVTAAKSAATKKQRALERKLG